MKVSEATKAVVDAMDGSEHRAIPPTSKFELVGARSLRDCFLVTNSVYTLNLASPGSTVRFQSKTRTASHRLVGKRQ